MSIKTEYSRPEDFSEVESHNVLMQTGTNQKNLKKRSAIMAHLKSTRLVSSEGGDVSLKQSCNREEEILQQKLENERILREIFGLGAQERNLKNQSNMLEIQKIFKMFLQKIQSKIFKSGNKTEIKNQSNSEEKSKMLKETLQQLSAEEKLQKAVRHFYDAYYFRQLRNDIDGKKNRNTRILSQIINSALWEYLLITISIVFQLLVFWEPVNQFVSLENNDFNNTIIVEIICLCFITVDAAFSLIFILLTRSEKLSKEFQKNQKEAIKILFNIIFIADFLNYITSYPLPTLRFSRSLRAMMMIVYSHKISRNVVGILHSLENLIFLYILQFLVIFLFAFVGINLLSDFIINGQYDKFTTDFGDFYRFFYILFLLSNHEYFPDMLIGPMQSSPYYLIYFIVFILLFVVFLIPVPQALVYEVYREHREKIHMEDLQNQKQNLRMCFECLDEQQTGLISQTQASIFFRKIYFDNNPEIKINTLLQLMSNNKITIDQFLQIFDIYNKYPQFSFTRIPAIGIWEKIRFYAISKFKLNVLVDSVQFNLLMLIITMINTSIIIASVFIYDSQTLQVFDQIDYLFFAFYLIEALLKITALGVYDYFDVQWNVFDFSLLFIQCFLDYILMDVIKGKIGHSLQANRLLKIARIQRVLRLFKAFRIVKIAKILFNGLSVFEQAQQLLFKIFSIIPLLSKFLVLIWVVIYFYAILSVEIIIYPEGTVSLYSGVDCEEKSQLKIIKQLQLGNEENPYIVWSACEFSDFKTISNALLMFFQFSIGQWAEEVNDFAHRTENFTKILIFISSFVLINVFLTAIMDGLVWEVFNQRIQQEPLEEEAEGQEFSSGLIKRIQNDPSTKKYPIILESQNEEEEFHKNSIYLQKESIQFNQNDEFIFIYEATPDPDEENLPHRILTSQINQKKKNNITLNDDGKIKSNFTMLGDQEFKNRFSEINLRYQEYIYYAQLRSLEFFQSKNNSPHQFIEQFQFHFKSLLNENLDVKNLVKLLLQTDQIITNKLLKNNSFTKFVFQNITGRWFTLNEVDSSISYQSLEFRPQDFIIQQDKNNLLSPTHYMYLYEFRKQEEQNQKLLRAIKKLMNKKNEDPTFNAQYILLVQYPRSTQNTQMIQIWYIEDDKQNENLIESIQLAKDLWRLIRGREELILKKIDELAEYRQNNFSILK